MKCYNKGPP